MVPGQNEIHLKLNSTSHNKLLTLVLKVHTHTHLVPDCLISLKRLRLEKRESLLLKCVMSVGLSVIWHLHISVAILLWANDVDSYSTRGNSTEFVSCRFKSNMGKDSFLYPAAMMWNRLPLRLKPPESALL